jgi:hypothetical protein
MKVIFLDFDGVLNSTAFHEKQDYSSFENGEESRDNYLSWAKHLDPVAVGRLNVLIEKTQAKIVISSSWRGGLNQRFLKDILEVHGFIGEIVGVTEHLMGPRAREIQDWLLRNRVENFVILDDSLDAEIRGHFVNTDFDVGLIDADVEKAVSILDGCCNHEVYRHVTP